MEIPVLDSGISRFQSPNLLPQLRAIWTWIALVVAAVATFSSLIRRLSRVIVRLRKGASVISQPSSSSYSSDDDDDDVSSCSSSEDDEDEDEISTAASEKDFGDFEEVQGRDECLDGEYFSWPAAAADLARDGDVVRYWDGGDRSRWDGISAVHVVSPGMILSAGAGGLEVWDPRTAESERAMCREEGIGRVVRVLGAGGDNSSCNKRAYVCDDVGKLMVVDLRNVKSPLAETWW